MRFINYIFVFLFIVSAGLQYNDPDPYLWMPIYLFGALICLLAARKIYIPAMYYAALLFYGVYACYLFFGKDGVLDWALKYNSENIAQSMKATKPWIEQTREFFGLAILIFAVSINTKWVKRSVLSPSLMFNVVK